MMVIASRWLELLARLWHFRAMAWSEAQGRGGGAGVVGPGGATAHWALARAPMQRPVEAGLPRRPEAAYTPLGPIEAVLCPSPGIRPSTRMRAAIRDFGKY